MKTLKTKKKSYNDSLLVLGWAACAIVLALVLSISMLTLNRPINYGLITADIPVQPTQLNDTSYGGFDEKKAGALIKTTVTVVLNKDGDLFFGDLGAFSSEFSNVRNKFIVRQVDHRPQVGNLINALAAWQGQRKQQQNIDPSRILVLVPAAATPLAIVVKVMAELKASGMFERIVLGHGLS